jgi:hypothetical protein
MMIGRAMILLSVLIVGLTTGRANADERSARGAAPCIARNIITAPLRASGYSFSPRTARGTSRSASDQA